MLPSVVLLFRQQILHLEYTELKDWPRGRLLCDYLWFPGVCKVKLRDSFKYYRNVMLDTSLCEVHFIAYKRRFESWFSFRLQAIGCHYTDIFLTVSLIIRSRDLSNSSRLVCRPSDLELWLVFCF
jgi:hypothetical protein